MECAKVVSLSLIRLALNVHLYGTDTVWRRTCIIHQHRNSASVARGHSFVSMGVLMGPSKPGGNIFSCRPGATWRWSTWQSGADLAPALFVYGCQPGDMAG